MRVRKYRSVEEMPQPPAPVRGSEGHSAVTWTHHLRTVLISLFGGAS